MKWKVNGKCSDCISEGVDLDFAVEVDGGCVWIVEGDALQDVFGDNGVVEVGSVAAVD